MIRRIAIGCGWLFFIGWLVFLETTKKEITDYLQPIPQLPFTIEMKGNGNWPSFVVPSGFTIPEAWGRWSDGRRAELRFRALQSPSCPYDMVVIMSVLTPKGEEQNVRFLFNGRILHTVSYPNSVYYERVHLSTAPLVRQRNRLTLEIGRPVRPADFDPGSRDIRRLGVALHALIFVPAESIRSNACDSL